MALGTLQATSGGIEDNLLDLSVIQPEELSQRRGGGLYDAAVRQAHKADKMEARKGPVWWRAICQLGQRMRMQRWCILATAMDTRWLEVNAPQQAARNAAEAISII